MSRSAFFNALADDDYLNSVGLVDDPTYPTILHNYTQEERPSSTTPFIVLRWGATSKPRSQDPDFIAKSPENLTVWVHWPQELTNDFNDLNKILDQIDSIALSIRDSAGSDGYILSFVEVGDRSGDLIDDGFHTITKTATYQLHSRKEPNV